MKRYVLGILVTFALLVPSAKAAETVFGFLDGKFYDSTATLRYQCFMDGNCYDLEGKPAPFKLVPVSQQTATPVTQVASGNQEKSNKVRSEIDAYINKINVQIDSLRSTPYPGVTWSKPGEDAKPLTVNDINTNSDFAQYRQTRLALDTNQQINVLNNRINELGPMIVEVQDYATSGVLPSIYTRSFLTSLGITW